jgi:hypothetical protein
MKSKKSKSIHDFGKIVYEALWCAESNCLSDLEKMITYKEKISFSKEDFIEEYFSSYKLKPLKNIEDYNEIEDFEFLFYKDSYDAVTFQTSAYDTILLLRERIKEFNLLLKKENNEL